MQYPAPLRPQNEVLRLGRLATRGRIIGKWRIRGDLTSCRPFPCARRSSTKGGETDGDTGCSHRRSPQEL